MLDDFVDADEAWRRYADGRLRGTYTSKSVYTDGYLDGLAALRERLARAEADAAKMWAMLERVAVSARWVTGERVMHCILCETRAHNGADLVHWEGCVLAVPPATTDYEETQGRVPLLELRRATAAAAQGGEGE